jgi:hypothetical protein
VYAIFGKDYLICIPNRITSVVIPNRAAVWNLLFSHHEHKSRFLARSLRALRVCERLGMTTDETEC